MFWLLVIFGLVPFGFPRLILEFAVTFFFGGFFVFLYSKLKDILGHSNLGTTQIYTHVSDSQIKNAVDANPLSGVKNKK